MGSIIVDKKAGTDYKAVLKEYNTLQKQAYTSSDVTADQVTALQTKLDDYIETHVKSSEKSSISDKMQADLDTMLTAVKLKSEQGKRSDQEWDTVREDLEGLLTSLAADPSDAKEMFKPTSTNNDQKSLSTGDGATFFATTSDTSLKEYLQQHPAAKPYAAMAEAAGKRQNPPISARIILSQIEAESSFDPHAIGLGKEKGLSQFTDDTWKTYGEGKDPFDPEAAINAQANYMAALIKQNNGSVERALMSYNGWDFSKSFNWNTAVKYPPSSKTYVQDITGKPFDQRNV